MNIKNTHNKILLGLLFTIFLLLPFFVNIFFSHDDQRYLYISSGAYNGTPCPYLVYEGFIYGSIISTLYKINNNIEWYSVASWTLYLISFLIIGFSIIRLKINELLKGLLVFTFSFLHFYMCIHPQFTILASELAFASFALLIQAKNKKYYTTAFVLFFIATQIRISAAFLPYMILFPIFFINNKYKKAFVSFSFLCIIGIVSFATDYMMYNKTDEWKHFYTYNEARAFIADNPQADNLLQKIKDPEKKKEYELLVKYRLFDPNILTEEEIVEYANILQQQRLETIKINLHNYHLMYNKLGGRTVIITIIWLMIVFIKKRNYKAILFVTSCFIMFLIANIPIISMSYPKERVLLTPIAALLLSCLYIAKTKEVPYFRTLICINIAILLYTYSRLNYDISKKINEPLTLKKEIEGMLYKSKSEKTMMLFPCCLYINSDRFYATKSPIAHKTILQGWTYNWPLAPKGYGNFKTLVDGIPMLVNKSTIEQLDIIEYMILHNYNIRVGRKIMAESENYYLIQFTSK